MTNHNRKFIKYRLLAFTLLLCAIMLVTLPLGMEPAHSESSEDNDWPWPWKAKIAIVIERVGSGLSGTEELFKLPVPVTVAITPGGPTAKKDAEAAKLSGKEIIVHLPMEQQRGSVLLRSSGDLYAAMNTSRVKSTLEQHLQDIPYRVGITTSSASLLNTNPRIMGAVFSSAKEHKLYFLDNSRHPQSVIKQTARKHGVPMVQSLFVIDDYYEVSYMKQRLRKAILSAHRNGYAVVIGHVGIQGKLTMEAIEQSIPLFIHHRVKPVFLSDIANDNLKP